MLKIEIDTSNAAFDVNPRRVLAELLEEVAQKIDCGVTPTILRDCNGNKVGTVYLDLEEDDNDEDDPFAADEEEADELIYEFEKEDEDEV